MIQHNCPACGGLLNINETKTMAICQYCGNEFRIDLKEDGSMDIVSAKVKEKKQERAGLNKVTFLTPERKKIEIVYPYARYGEEYDVYFADSNLILRFHPEHIQLADAYVRSIKKLEFPNDKMKEIMHYYLPEHVGTYTLEDGSKLVAIKKIKWVYPLGCFENLDSKHVCWIISRLENLACLCSYNGVFPKLVSNEQVIIDPENHQVMLYEGWEYGKKDREKEFLRFIREAGKTMLDPKCELRPQIKMFLNSDPKPNAMEDFAFWDKCLDSSFDKREFIEWSVTEREVFGG